MYRQHQTYAIRSPQGTHYRPATCEEVNCSAWRDGWWLRGDLLPDVLKATVVNSGKRYERLVITSAEVNEVYPEAGEYWVFEAGQACFRSGQHTVRLERPAFYFVGKHPVQQQLQIARATPMAEVDFVDHMGTHLDQLRTRIERG